MDEIIGFRLYPSCGDRGSFRHVSVFWLRWCGWEWDGAWTRVGSGGVVLCEV